MSIKLYADHKSVMISFLICKQEERELIRHVEILSIRHSFEKRNRLKVLFMFIDAYYAPTNNKFGGY